MYLGRLFADIASPVHFSGTNRCMASRFAVPLWRISMAFRLFFVGISAGFRRDFIRVS
jgi:hypothetical protein